MLPFLCMATQVNYRLREKITLVSQQATFWCQNCHLNLLLLIKRAYNTKSCQVAGWRILSFQLSSKHSTSATATDYHLRYKKAATSWTHYSASIWRLATLHLGDHQENLKLEIARTAWLVVLLVWLQTLPLGDLHVKIAREL